MLVNNFDEKAIAKIFAHYAYRNTAVEDLHAGTSVVMDESVYQQVYQIVSKRVRKIKRNHDLLLSFTTKEEVEDMLSNTYYPRAKEFYDYYNEMCAYSIFPYGTEWDEPILLEGDVNVKDLATYILGGAFIECCQQNRRMNDEAMCYIKKDIYNRFYTLVMKKLLYAR